MRDTHVRHAKLFVPLQAAEIKAMRIWRKTVIRVAKHNLRESLGLETYTQAVNSFAAHVSCVDRLFE